LSARGLSQKRARIERVQIYLITDASPCAQPIERFLREAIAGGVGMVQLREKGMSDARLLEVATRCALVCKTEGIPFVVNDRIDIAIDSGADGVHLGQEDLPIASARRLAGEDFIVGLSTHTPDQIEEAIELDPDYIGVGPIHETPTKAGRCAVGVHLVSYAAQRAAQPFFGIGGLDPSNVADVIRAGARGVSVLRWVCQATDPMMAVRELLGSIEEAKGVREGGVKA
jgi:thiamine-phosphate pyrophosphorylase